MEKFQTEKNRQAGNGGMGWPPQADDPCDVLPSPADQIIGNVF
jgi:hypothetical protein